MIERKTLNVSLTPELHAFVGTLVDTGNYNNASEVVRSALRLLQHDEALRRGAIANARPDADQTVQS